ncbi:MAG: 16S rRNA (cytidine(1402)-2'-O)-methyltransferase [Steroidobacteraceae bacterium]
MVRQRGRLEVVATPIGNLSDLSVRGRESLAGADLVAAEDTRRTGHLLATLGLHKPMVSLHEHNETERVDTLLARLEAGDVIALTSDAGTPLVSDPGLRLVERAVAAGFEVRSIPGPSAVIAALSVAGLATDRFAFEGFLPAHAGERRELLRSLASERRTLVFFEAPHRLRESLKDFATVFGTQRRAAIARELTKAFETVYRGTFAELLVVADNEPNLERGEITLVVAGLPGGDAAAYDTALLGRALELLLKELPPARAAAIAARLCGVPRSAAYALALTLGQADEEKG